MSQSKNIRLGVAGLGAMGASHAASIHAGKVAGLELAAVADASVERLKAFPAVPGFSDANEMLASGTIDAVIIATPHFSHTTLGIAALDAGLHVLVEKPISAHKEDCEKLLAANARAKNQVFAAMFNQRTDPRYRKLKELLDDGSLGPVYRINWTITDWFRSESYYRSGAWRATWAGEGGGVLLNQCPHNLDLWQWLFGMPDSIYARCQLGRFHPIEVEDSVTAIFEYSSGVQGTFATSTGEAPGTNRLEVAADAGKVIVEGNAPELIFTRNEVAASKFRHETLSKFGKPATWNIQIPVPGNGGQHLEIMQNFADAILEGKDLIAPGIEGIHSVELANAMLLSSFRQTAVRLPIDSAEFSAELQNRIAESASRKIPRPAQRANGTLAAAQ